jgi:FdhD protein
MSKDIVSLHNVTLVSKENDVVVATDIEKEIISEISLKLIINSEEQLSLLCINQYLEELALGFLYNETVIDSMDDVEEISFTQSLMAVVIKLKNGKSSFSQENLRSITSGCGKGITYINPLKLEKFEAVKEAFKISIDKIWEVMRTFNKSSELYKTVGGVHSVLFHHDDYSIFNEDIGRHNCIDKITGMLLKQGKMNYPAQGMIFTSGRVSSEIMLKLIRLKIPVVVSRSAPSLAAVELAEKFGITLLGYVRGEKANIYTGKDRILGLK